MECPGADALATHEVVAAAGVELALEFGPRFAPRLQARIAGLAERAPAELTYGNLWLFRRRHRWRLHDDAWPCVSGLGYDGLPHAVPLFDVREAPADVLHRLIDLHGCLMPLTEREANAIDRRAFALGSHRDDSDYLYPAAQFREFRARTLRQQGRVMAQLQATHALTAEPYAPHLQPEALQVLQGWMDDHHKAPGEADEPACRDALALAPQLALEGFLYRANGEAAGFLLAEELQPGVWVVRFCKGLARLPGLVQHMFHHFATRTDREVTWLNLEQDLGQPSFRHTKRRYRPAALLPKWRLLPRVDT